MDFDRQKGISKSVDETHLYTKKGHEMLLFISSPLPFCNKKGELLINPPLLFLIPLIFETDTHLVGFRR